MATLQEDRPDLIVGIDFGMTYTGVAWTNLSNTVQSIDDWPGLMDAHQVKVPTKFVAGRSNKWGLLCDGDDVEDNEQLEECFKIYLDQRSIDAARRNNLEDMPGTIEEAQRLTTEYLRYVYSHIKYSIEANTGGSWKYKTVEFSFSMPTTWTSLDILNDFEKAIRNAGFGGENTERHSVKLGLTEAEAAAVYVASNPQVNFASGDILLVCDAGGGTTDLGLIQVEDANLPQLKQVNAVSGVGIGSTVIDGAFQALVQTRLDNHPDGFSLPHNLARKMAKSTQFQSVKHKFGSPAADFAEFPIKLDILGLNISQGYTHPGLGIEMGRMKFTRAEIRTLFDTQIRGITRKIDEQLEWMRVNRNGQAPKYLVLSGGLGGSEYVKAKLQENYGLTGLSIVRSQEPRLSVVKGLVMDRKQKLVSGSSTLKTRIARASYGVVCRQIYDPIRHPGAVVQPDFYNKNQKWAIDQIEWLIRKGDTIDTDTAKEKPFTKKIKPGDTSRQWDTKIVVSHNDRSALPRMLKQAGAHELCIVKSDLKEVAEQELELKNKRCWQGKRYYLALFTIRVIVGPADLKFELWFKGRRYNRSHDSIKIQWDAAGASARPPSIDGPNDETVDYYGRY